MAYDMVRHNYPSSDSALFLIVTGAPRSAILSDPRLRTYVQTSFLSNSTI